MKHLLSCAALSVLLAATPAAARSVAEFLKDAHALKAKGPLALFSPKLKELRGEVTTVAAAYRTRNRAAKAAGRPTDSCPPDKAQLKPQEFLAELERIPANQRAMSLDHGFAIVMKHRYPCTR